MQSSGETDDRVQAIRRTVSGYRPAQIYITFAQLNVAGALADGPLSVPDLARRCQADERGMRRYLDAAVAFGLVEWKADDVIQLTDLGYHAFAPGSDHSVANFLKLEGAFYERWGRLGQAVRTGQRPPENRAQEDDPGWVRIFTLALFDNARQVAPATAEAIDKALPPTTAGPLSIIDIGGGHGAYGMALARRRPDATVRIFDLPRVIDVTSELVEQSGLSDRVTAVSGDFHVDPLGSDYDAVMLFGVLHGETPDSAGRLLSTIYDSLKPGGLLLIRSQGRAKSELEPGERELFDLHMLLSTEGGEVKRQTDTSHAVQQAGFDVRDPIVIPDPGSGQILVFRRP